MASFVGVTKYPVGIATPIWQLYGSRKTAKNRAS